MSTWLDLTAQCPLGSIMRARKAAYAMGAHAVTNLTDSGVDTGDDHEDRRTFVGGNVPTLSDGES